MKLRTVNRLLYAHEVDMGGLRVRQPIPTNQVQQIDPFLLLHHAKVKVPDDRDPRHAGVGAYACDIRIFGSMGHTQVGEIAF